MQNYAIKVDLLKLKGAFVTAVKGKTATKKCVVIPIDDAGLYAGSKGIYLGLSAIEMSSPKFEDTHCLRVNVNKLVYDTMSEEERKSIPIVGGMHVMNGSRLSVTDTSLSNVEVPDNDLPF